MNRAADGFTTGEFRAWRQSYTPSVDQFKRRTFLSLAPLGAAALGQVPAPAAHPDSRNDAPGAEHYFLGNGLLTAAIQTCAKPGTGTHCGLVLFSPEHFTRRWNTFLYHVRSALADSRLGILLNGVMHFPEPGASDVKWIYPGGIPTVEIVWRAEGCLITEHLYCAAADPYLIRRVTVRNETNAPLSPVVVAPFRPSQVFFDEYEYNASRGVLMASGYHRLELFSLDRHEPHDRELRVPLTVLAPGSERSATVVLAVDASHSRFDQKGLTAIRNATQAFWDKAACVSAGDKNLDHLFRVSQSGIRAAAAASGKIDGGLLQYNCEWVRDASMVAVGALMAGYADQAEVMLDRILDRSVDDEGRTLDSGRHRPPDMIELDQNGQILWAVYMHWVWTGSDSLMRKHWRRLSAVADYPLQSQFRDPAIGLVKNTREFWERHAAFGVREGYELAYQTWDIVGWQAASAMARHMDDAGRAERWADASRLMRSSLLSHPRFSLVDSGRFIKRRLANGEVQRTFEPPDRNVAPPSMPLHDEKINYCDPDASEAIPIMLGLVDGASDLARNTLAWMEKLWNQRWTGGGYGRYDVTSEPDSPGPWPFATLFIARAHLEAGNSEKVRRALDWLVSVQGGKSGGWFEFYGERPSPPLLPVGFIPWNWAEIVMLMVHHMLGVRPSPAELTIRPRLLVGLDDVRATLVINSARVNLRIRRSRAEPHATVNGIRHPLSGGALTIPKPNTSMEIEILV